MALLVDRRRLWQPHGEPGEAWTAFDVDRTTVPRDNGPGNRKPQTGARGSRGASRVHLVEPVEDVRDVLRRDARTVVRHREDRCVVARLGAQLDAAAIRRVPYGVGDEVLDDLLEPVRI